MIVSLIVAAAEDNAIGRDNTLPWHLPEDLKFFKRTTMGKPLIMGRRTYESLGKPLPGRLNIVLTGRKMILPAGAIVTHDLSAAIALAQNEEAGECFIIGGGKVFEAGFQFAERIYLTRVHTWVPDADTFLPAIDHTHWKVTWEEPHKADDKHLFPYTFQKLERIEL